MLALWPLVENCGLLCLFPAVSVIAACDVRATM